MGTVTVKLSVTLMCHEQREPLWRPLLDSIPRADAVVDNGRLGRWGNGRRALQGYDPDASWHMVLQDDALPAPDLIEALELWLPTLPPHITCLYAGKVRGWRVIHDQFAKPPCWMSMHSIQWGVALVYPTHVIKDLIKIGDRMDKIQNMDSRISEANKRTHKLPVYIPSPSWVEHANTPSTVPGRKPNRHALTHYAGPSLLQWGEPGKVPVIRVPDFVRPIIRKQASIYGGSS